MTNLASPPAPAGGPKPPRRSRKWWYIGGVCVLVLALAGFGIWYVVFRDDSPPAVNIERATESLDTKSSGNGQSTSSLDGTWKVDPSIGSFADFTSSFVGYRVQEELAGIGTNTAVGRTPDVSGSITIDGSKIPKADFTADLSTLKSDEGFRDDTIRHQAIETDQFPTATFELTEPIELDKIPAEGTKTSADATGTLTLHGVTKDVTIPLEAQRTGDTIAVTGQLDLPFADYGIQKPTSFKVLSIDDRGILEVQLFLTKST
jgi:polyisoprenoid-binding protein YceI